MSSGSSYLDTYGFDFWFCIDNLYDLGYNSETEFEKRREDMMSEWCYNSWGNEAKILEYKITYTDEWGRECDVEIEY